MAITVYAESGGKRLTINRREASDAQALVHALRHARQIGGQIGLQIRDLSFSLDYIDAAAQGCHSLADCQKFLDREGLAKSEPQKLAETLTARNWRYTVKPVYRQCKTAARVDIYDAEGVPRLSHEYERGTPVWRESDASLATANAGGKKYAAIREINEKLRVFPNTQT